MCFGVTNTCSNHYASRKNNITGNIKKNVLHNHSCCSMLVWCITLMTQIAPFLHTISSLLLDNGEQKDNNLTVVRWEAKWKFWLTLRVRPTCFKNVVRADAIAVLQNKEWNILLTTWHIIFSLLCHNVLAMLFNVTVWVHGKMESKGLKYSVISS